MGGFLKPYATFWSEKETHNRWGFIAQFIRLNKKGGGSKFWGWWFRATITFRDANGRDKEQNDWIDKVVSEGTLKVVENEGRNMIKVLVNLKYQWKWDSSSSQFLMAQGLI